MQFIISFAASRREPWSISRMAFMGLLVRRVPRQVIAPGESGRTCRVKPRLPGRAYAAHAPSTHSMRAPPRIPRRRHAVAARGVPPLSRRAGSTSRSITSASPSATCRASSASGSTTATAVSSRWTASTRRSGRRIERRQPRRRARLALGLPVTGADRIDGVGVGILGVGAQDRFRGVGIGRGGRRLGRRSRGAS